MNFKKNYKLPDSSDTNLIPTLRDSDGFLIYPDMVLRYEWDDKEPYYVVLRCHNGVYSLIRLDSGEEIPIENISDYNVPNVQAYKEVFLPNGVYTIPECKELFPDER